MRTIQQIITTHNIDTTKENFPVNTIRLLYLIFIYSLVTENPEEKASTMLEAIPLISAILSKRTDLRLSNQEKNINHEWMEIQPELETLEKLTTIDTGAFIHLFSVILPSQEEMLFNIVHQSQDKTTSFKPTDVMTTLKLRALDSLAYSTVVAHLVNKPEYDLSIHYVTHIIYQLNDLLDSILFAKEDTENNNFSPFEIIRKAAQNSDEAKAHIKSTIDQLQNDLSQVELPEHTQESIADFFSLLLQVLGDVSPKETTAQS